MSLSRKLLVQACIAMLSLVQISQTANVPQGFTLYLDGADCQDGSWSYPVEGITTEECAERCRNKVGIIGCKGFVFEELTDGTTQCTLKSILCQNLVKKDKSTVYAMKSPFSYMDDLYLPGFGCTGHTIKTVDVPVRSNSYYTCLPECLKDDDCVGFVLSDNKRGGATCETKSQLCSNAIRDPKFYGAHIKRVFVEGYSDRDDNWYTALSRENGNIIAKHSGISKENCAQKCNDNGNCEAFEYRELIHGEPKSTENCFLGGRILVNKPSSPTRSVHIKLGVPAKFELVHNKYGYDCPEGTYKIAKKSSLTKCAKGCKAKKGCAGFVWDALVPSGEKNCWYKEAICNNLSPNPGHAVYKLK